MLTTDQTYQNSEKILPANRDDAMQALIRVTKKLLDLADLESQHLARSDLIAFAALQDEKGQLSRRYMNMSEEFRARLEDFRGVDTSLLDRLDALQRQLGESTRHNNKTISDIKGRAEQNTQNTLLTAQELAAKHPVELHGTQANENEEKPA